MGITACLIWPSASWHSCSSRCHRHLGWDDLPLWTWNLRVKVENVHSDWELLWRHNLGDNHSWACWHHGNHPAVPADGQPGISKSGTWQFSKPFCTLLVSCLHLASCPRHGLDMTQILLEITHVCLQLFHVEIVLLTVLNFVAYKMLLLIKTLFFCLVHIAHVWMWYNGACNVLVWKGGFYK